MAKEYTTEELKTLAKYPFLEESKKYVETLKLTLDEIGKHPIYSSAIKMGKERVLSLLENKFNPEMDEKLELELLILSYPIARILTNLTGNRILVGRYANAESKKALKNLRNENEKTIEKIKDGLKLRIDDGIDVVNYLRLTRRLVKEDAGWKLVNHTVEKGRVSLKEGDELTLVKEAIRDKVLEPINLKKPPESLKKPLNELKTAFTLDEEEQQIEFIDDKATPKCISHIMSLVNRNEANHNARFILATFLIGIGLKEEEILKVFSKSPKYDENKTRYQVEFLTGKKGATKYTCPGCETIKSYGLCKADCRVKHPQQYYRRNARTTDKKQ